MITYAVRCAHLAIFAVSLASVAFAGGKDGEKAVTPQRSNQTYRETCGACHSAHLPWLLPSKSWSVIVGNMTNHHGNAVDLEAKVRNEILGYLTTNAADKSAAKLPAKIMKSLKGDIPARITDIPMIRDKHREIPASTFARKEVGSPANCTACHPSAERGLFDDDDVHIPGKPASRGSPRHGEGREEH